MKGKFLSLEQEAQIRTLSKEGYPYNQIRKKLKENNIMISKSVISNVLNGIGKRRKTRMNGQEFKVCHHKDRRSKSLIERVRKMAHQENPLTQREMSKRCKVSLSTINRIIHEDLDLRTLKKTPVHHLTQSNIENRETNSRKLYEDHLAGVKWEYVVTLDEAWMYLSDCKKKRGIYYQERGIKRQENWVLDNKEKFPKGFMVVGAISGRGTLPLFRVPGKTKINARFYIDFVLKPLIKAELPKLYPSEMDKVFLHHDKATSHTARETQDYMERVTSAIGMKFIDNQDIPVCGPDISPMDFFGFGFLKQKLQKRRATTLDGLWKALREEWATISIKTVRSVFKNWKKRCRLVHKRQGCHIEQLKQIHRRVLKELD